MKDHRVTSFLQRLPAGAPARVSVDIGTAFAIVETAREKVSAIRSDAKLTRDGQNAAIATALAKGPVAHMKQIRAGIEKDLAGVRGERDGMKRRITEAAAFPEAGKTEVRTWLRALPDAERFRIAHETTDQLIVEAIAGAPHYLSSIKADVCEALIWRTVEQTNRTHLVELATLETAYEEAEAAVAVAKADLKRESGPGDREFEQIAG